ncbi:MAG TPA: nicotinamide riboside transporter PnuC [Bacteroidetes bacterium]|nr:nicotinamide riboside transporter PnuC [Bacteroidota bacterium]
MEFTLLTSLELIATICGLVHVFLLTREKVIAWPFGIATVTIYVYIFYVSKLYSDTILHVFYIFINTYGWYNWSRRKKETAAVKVSYLSPSGVAILVGTIIAGTLIWGYIMDTRTDASFAYFDAYTTVASLSAQYLLTQKKIENWVVWIAVNIVAMPIYFMKGLYLTSGLYFVYLLLVISGFVEWRKVLKMREREIAGCCTEP